MINTQLYQNIKLLLVIYILLPHNVMCSTVEIGTTEYDPRSGNEDLFNVVDDIVSSSSSPLSSGDYTVDEQEAMIHKKDSTIKELKEQIQYLEIIHKVEKKEFNCQSMALIGALYAKNSATQECGTPKQNSIPLNVETIVIGFINRIKELEGNVYQLKDEKEKLKEEVETKDSNQGRKCKEEIDILQKENRDLENQINTFTHQLTVKEIALEECVYQNKEAIWKRYSHGRVPEDGVLATDEGHKAYLCRAEKDGDVVPGSKWIADKGCFVFHNGKGHTKNSYEVLTKASSFEWTECHGDEIPHRAVAGGKTKGGEVLYIGRIKEADGHYRVGKVQPSLKGCYNYPLVNGDWTIHADYQILVWK